MKLNGGPWDGREVELGDHQVGMVLVDRPNARVWLYDSVPTPDGHQLDAREDEGRELDDDKRFDAGYDPQWTVRVLDEAPVEEEVGL